MEGKKNKNKTKYYLHLALQKQSNRKFLRARKIFFFKSKIMYNWMKMIKTSKQRTFSREFYITPIHTYKSVTDSESCNVLYKYNYYNSHLHATRLLRIFCIIPTHFWQILKIQSGKLYIMKFYKLHELSKK